MITSAARSVERFGRNAAVDPPSVVGKDRALLLGRQRRRAVDVASRVVEIEASLGVDAFHRADHLRCEQDVLRRDYPGQKVDAGLMIDTGIEEYVPEDALGQRRPLLVLCDA